MSTRIDKLTADGNSVGLGYEGQNVATDEYLPSCTIEDVDRAVFNLFNIEIPLFYEFENSTKRIPVIFATGERFAVLRRKKPLRDKVGAIVLPLISIMRNEISQQVAMGPGEQGPAVIKKRLSPEDPRYQRILNNRKIKSQDSAATPDHINPGAGNGTKDGTLATRRSAAPSDDDTRSGMYVKASLGANLFEIIEMPPVKFYSATYEVTFWAQYTQQMNDMIMAMMSTYHNNYARQFRIESDKGYWFVATVADSITPGTNYEDFTEDERLVKYSFNITVPGYLVMPDYPGSVNGLRKYISAPEISFTASQVPGSLTNVIQGGVISADVNSHILNDFAMADDQPAGQAIAASGIASSLRIAGVDIPGAAIANIDNRPSSMKSKTGVSTSREIDISVGGKSLASSKQRTLKITRDPFTGKKVTKIISVKTTNQKKGETVYGEGLVIDLGKLFK